MCVCGGVYACGCLREVGKRDMVTIVIICIMDLVFLVCLVVVFGVCFFSPVCLLSFIN